uniref:(S)-2-hydroxy-acid oxidase n=1 Tax=Phallusia mammillata TaxID=59560 RepID=A0A6F9DDM8_9ASCI|nr:hydroxyacid oxidase 1-like [Phallusia mammillata]
MGRQKYEYYQLAHLSLKLCSVSMDDQSDHTNLPWVGFKPLGLGASKPVCIQDFEQLAKESLTKNAWDYYSSGATDEQTLHDNCMAFKRYRLRPKVLNDVSCVDISTSVLGQKVDIPICIASTAMNKMADPCGEIAAAKAAASVGSGFMLSTWATTSIEEVATETGNSLKWMQLYIYKDREVTKQIVKRAEKCGFKGVFLTVDTPVLGQRYKDVKNHFSLPSNLKLANFEVHEQASGVKSSDNSGLSDYVNSMIDPSLQWSDVKWLKKITKMPVVLKGIVTSEMALKAVAHGVDGIVVSNHGARQLDGVPATIDALPEVVNAVNGRCEVYLDGGVRSGTDVLKAIALGAKAVFIGRPVLWGLAYNGEEGVRTVLSMLKDEFKNSLQLMGCRSIKELQEGQNLIVPEAYYLSRL